MRIVVIGCRGQVGWELVRSLAIVGDVFAWDRRTADMSEPGALADRVRSQRPDVIVNAAAYTDVDRAESDEPRANLINGIAVGALAEAAREAGALFVHYSTDYVFDGAATVPYREDAETGPLNAYGRSKLLGERATVASGVDYLIFRTTWVYAARGANFVLTMLRLMRERPELRVISDQFGAPTSARFIADATAHAIARSISERHAGRFESGLFNLTADGVTTWHGFAQHIFERARAIGVGDVLKTKRIEAIATDDYPLPAARPAYSVLDGSKLQQRFNLRRPQWHEGVDLVLDELLKQ
ncbi:TPA: dTDP-4-dehydrorhamnose reductase [Burkholderia multivorans]|uniref:dTDP-4-dehydrorhamnose reductase n=1 Tax=Burkholderia multivorans TaxID=87883 RepID=UPI000CFEF1A6|nr:dTDP-4-dehydrorhamnose reductase [Burkholderia multivorans]MBU9301179.1 dTDP-4-dehydrorhamnose reductase [Burkholderia multivorans]MBU9305670.1 dTDP-4-dehydrorhamnose reductase [Burkholderia multivorans]MBU9409630.1 dTDP-4-dehydrorhamnose reductase [Burkholderia multivorans]MBU9510421.1 dTDP-4-dehydrorhamnose reductase [Burkholderia multivorans]MCA8462502.1 dTDP-4-dehydrorhamnose reductase [Burkholderia multivorans]